MNIITTILEYYPNICHYNKVSLVTDWDISDWGLLVTNP